MAVAPAHPAAGTGIESGQQGRGQHDAGQGQPRRAPVEHVVQAGGGCAETAIGLVELAPHGIQHVGGTVAGGQGSGPGQSGQQQARRRPEQSGKDAVGQVLAHALHTGPGHAVGIQLLRVASHQHGHGPAGRLQIALFQRQGHTAGVFVQAAGRQTEGDHDHTDDPGGRAAEHLSGKPDRQCRQQAHRQDHGQTGRQTGQCHAWPVGTAAEDSFHDGGQGPHAADGMDAGRGFPQQSVQQQGGGQEKEGGQCAHRPAPDAPVAAAGEIGESVASAAAAREGLQPDSGCFRGWGRKEMPFSPCRRAGTG